MSEQMNATSRNETNIAQLLELYEHQSTALDEVKSRLDVIDDRLRSIQNWQNLLIGGAIALSAIAGIGGTAVAIVGLLVLR